MPTIRIRDISSGLGNLPMSVTDAHILMFVSCDGTFIGSSPETRPMNQDKCWAKNAFRILPDRRRKPSIHYQKVFETSQARRLKISEASPTSRWSVARRSPGHVQIAAGKLGFLAVDNVIDERIKSGAPAQCHSRTLERIRGGCVAYPWKSGSAGRGAG